MAEGRILKRKKRKYNQLLRKLAKELISEYLCSLVLKTSPTDVSSAIREAGLITKKPTKDFIQFLNERQPDNNKEDDVVGKMLKILYREFVNIGVFEYPEILVGTTRDAESILRKGGPAKRIGGIGDDSLAPVPALKPIELVADKESVPSTPVKSKKSAALFASTEVIHAVDEFVRKKAPPKPPKKYSEKMQAEAAVLQRVQELQKEGMWYDKRLPKVKEPDRKKSHWDYMMEEIVWMQNDFQQERKWKQMAARKLSKAVLRHFSQKALAAQRAVKEEEIRKRRVASFISKEVQKFWGNVKKLLELREQSKIEELKKKALDQQLSFIVDQTEKYSDLLAEKFQSVVKKEPSKAPSDLDSLSTAHNSDAEFEPKSDSDDDEETIAKAEEDDKGADINNEVLLLEKESQMELDDILDDLPPGYIEDRLKAMNNITEEPVPGTSSQLPSSAMNEGRADDEEFQPPSEYESDCEKTIDEQEQMEIEDGTLNHKEEIQQLQEEGEIAIEDLIARYSGYLNENVPDVEESGDSSSDEDDEMRSEKGSGSIGDTLSDSGECVDDALTTLVKDGNENELASLLQTLAPDNTAGTDDDTALNSVAALAESFQPKGYTLSSTNVVTKIPHLLKHTLREYQHIGLDWLVAMCDKRLNGILADEMGLGKTIQTIALLAHLAEKGNWGPHLIIVPTSVMLNWEMEFKKWCPGFKILTYYGSQKERKLKRTGWTKQNSFHVCITSYKLVIQDHQSFRRKRWSYLILDEAQNIKNFKSQRWQLLLNFNAERRLLLTGTPLQNNLMELWSLMHFLMPNVFQSHREFREWFSNPVTGMVEGSAEYNDNIIRRLHKVLRPFILRRLKSEVEKQLPKKYEHLIMCRLSKRQRFLYEEFMSRTRTRDTLNAGNLLSVINVLMQLRKVCNHPNLFEPRPVLSPFHADGISYHIPSLVWNMADATLDDMPSYPIFTMTGDDLYFSMEEAWRVKTLTPILPEDEVTADRNAASENSEVIQMSEEKLSVKLSSYSKIKIFKDLHVEPPAKRIKLSDLTKPLPPPMPRITSSLPFFLTTVDPSGLFEDPDFVNHVSQGAPSANCPPISTQINGDIQFPKHVTESRLFGVKNNGDVKHVSEGIGGDSMRYNTRKAALDELEARTEDTFDITYEGVDHVEDLEIVESIRKRKVASYHSGLQGVLGLGLNPVEFEMPEIQKRSLINRHAVLNKLYQLNKFRCQVNPILGQSVVESCEVFIPSANGRRQRYVRLSKLKPPSNLSDMAFKSGISEIDRVIRAKLRFSRPALSNHPSGLQLYTTCLEDMIVTIEERLSMLKSVLSRFVIFIPAVAAPVPQCKIFRPSPSRYSKQIYLEQNIKEGLRQPSELLHPIITSMTTQFPDPRLIQYDCGKLQTLDRLLRQLKVGSHRVLIFTQMARMLDVLEAFLNYHGHIYLRLDGSTRIDQRQILMERFNTDKRIFCFILSTRSGGVGVNLTGADTVIFYDSDWNPTMDAQAQDRCHRIGQTRDVHIYRMISEKTVEENILKKSNQKRMLGEIAIEGGNFTTSYFTKSTIHDLFNVDHNENDANKRLAELTVSIAEPELKNHEDLVGAFDVTVSETTDKNKAATQLLECALLAAEDETDVKAAQTVRAEAAAELAEFDENISLEELDSTQLPVEDAPRSEIEYIFDQLNPVEIYAVKLMENCLEDWTTETYASAEKDIERQKQVWEEAQLKHLQDLESRDEEDDKDSDDDEMLTYCSVGAENQVWIAQNASTEIIMPIWYPPTPPQENSDVYVMDSYLGYLYNRETMDESLLPPVYIPPKHPKKPTPSGSVTKIGYERPPDFPMDISEPDEPATSKKSPKVQRRDDPIFAPRSLFDRPSPALAKLRRDYRLQKYSARPVGAQTKGTLGPGSISFPIIPPAAAKAPPPPPPDMVEWLVSEDNALLQVIQNMVELPLSLLVVNLAQTPNWDLAAESVSSISRTHRTAKQCKWRYENIIGPREEGKLFYETPALSPSSPATKKKKTKAFIKVAPPSPSKAARYLKTAQLMAQDNNAQCNTLYCQKFDTIKSIISKRVPTSKPMTINPSLKSNKQSSIFTEHGILYDNPVPATIIAQARLERLQLERKKLLYQQQQAAVAAAAAPAGAVVTNAPSTTQSPSPTAIAMALANTAPSGSSTPQDPTAKLTRAPYTASSIVGLVPVSSNSDILTKGLVATGPTLVNAHKRSINLTQQSLQQQYLLQQKNLQVQPSPIQQALTSPVQNQQILAAHAQQTASMQVQQGVASQQGQPLLRTSQLPVPQPGQTQTVVLSPGLAQAIGAAVANVSAPSSVGSTAAIVTTSAASNMTKNVQILGQQQELSSTAGGVGGQQSPQTIVSLTPMTSQITTKLLPGSQGMATFVSTSPRASTVTTLNPGVAQGNKMGGIQLQYLRPGAVIRQQVTPATAATASQQQAMQMKEQQLKRIQVVTSGTAVSSSPGLNMPLAPSHATFTQATIASAGISNVATVSNQKNLPVMTLTGGTGTSLGTLATVVNQGTSRHVQLVKQQTIGGKTVTRTVSEAEVAALLKQHGLSQQTRLTIGGQAVQAAMNKNMPSIPVSAATHTFLTQMGLQNMMKVQPTTGSSIATLVKAPVSQAGQQTGTLTFPMQLSQVKTPTKATGAAPKPGTPVQNLSPLHQQLLIHRRQQQQQAPTASKLTHIAQVSQGSNMPTQLIVQTAPKQMQGGVTVPAQFQQVFKQVTASGQVIGQGAQVLHAHMVGKPLGNPTGNVIVTSSSGGTPSLIPANATQSASFSNLGTQIGGNTNQNIHARIIPVSTPTGLKQTIQVVSTGPGGPLIGPGTLARPMVPGATQSPIYPTIKLASTPVQGQPMSIRLQSASTVAGDTCTVPGTLTAVSVASPGVAVPPPSVSVRDDQPPIDTPTTQP